MMLRLPAVLMVILGILPCVARANALYPVTLDEKVKNAGIIAEGVVESQYSFWNERHTMIYTANKVKVFKVFSGTVSSGYLHVLTQGGTVGNINIQASDLLQLEAGDMGTFFCFPNQINLAEPQGNELLLDVYASSQGCYKYNTVNFSAHVPFESFSSITKGLYPAITALTGKAIINLDPSVSFEPVSPSFGQDGITTFSPALVNAGALQQADSNLLTINGTGFGTPSGSAAVLFPDADQGGGTNITIAYSSPLIQSWADNQVKLKVPAKAGTGIFQVRNSSGTLFSSATPLRINYAVLTGTFTGGAILQIGLVDENGLGGYDVLYSNSTLGGGRNLNSAPEKAPVQRAFATWRQICGANIREAGTSTTQQISSDDGINIVVLDNTNTGVPLLPSGVLASTYSYAAACTSAGQFIYPAFKMGFDVLLRNNGVSGGTTNFTLGPCPPATNISQLDFETVMLHELGHALSLGHIVDSYEGNQLPYVNPPKLMNYAIPNGVKRVTPDFSAKIGADYNISQKFLNFGVCVDYNEMQAVVKTLEPKDDCPLSFPVATTLNGTQVNFDLVHATSNFNVDPQFDAITCNGNGTGVTNNAWYAIKTNNSGGDLTLTVSNYETSPFAQQNCTVAGVQLALYRVNSCPQGQNFPDPIACRSFNGNGVLASFTNLEKEVTYLIMVNGLTNTKANFTLTLNGTVLPVKLVSFNGSQSGDDNIIHWAFDELTDLYDVTLQRSTDGTSFETLEYWNAETYELKINYIDKVPPPTSYYRLVYTDKQGVISYSSIIQLKHKVPVSWRVYPNPAKDNIHIYSRNVAQGRYSLMVFNSSGMLVTKRDQTIGSSAQNFLVPVTNLPSGNYRLVVSDRAGMPVFTTSITLLP